MREILFRGKSIESGEWLYGSLLQLSCECNNVRIFPVSAKNVHESISINSKTIGQFTGLTDKNGKKIFEGDIVKVPVKRLSSSNWWQKTNKHHGFVGDFVHKIITFKTSDDSSGFDFRELPITRAQIEKIAMPRGQERDAQAIDSINFDAKDVEIIGSAFDNPEMVKE